MEYNQNYSGQGANPYAGYGTNTYHPVDNAANYQYPNTNSAPAMSGTNTYAPTDGYAYTQQGGAMPIGGNAAYYPNTAVNANNYPQVSATPQVDPAEIQSPNCTDVNGLRWTWSTYPNTLRSKKNTDTNLIPLPDMVIPMSCMYMPLYPLDASQTVLGDPSFDNQQCVTCGTFWSMHSYVPNEKFWHCPSCQHRNPIPKYFHPQHPALNYETVEYIIPSSTNAAGSSPQQEDGALASRYPVFIFAIDLCISESELNALRVNLLESIEWLPPQALLGFITFASNVSVWELWSDPIRTSYVFRGDRAYTPTELNSMLHLGKAKPAQGRFLVRQQDCSFCLTEILQSIQIQNPTLPYDTRPLRATGTAVELAAFLMESVISASDNSPAQSAINNLPKAGKILLFTGGPCTRGPGKIVGIEKAQMMRSQRDILDGETPFYESSFTFYNQLEKRLSTVSASLDVFVESFDQVGIMEMRSCVNNTGGTFICGDTFNHTMFSTSLRQYFERCGLRGSAEDSNNKEEGGYDLMVKTAFGVSFEVHTSTDTLVSGVIGPCNVDTKAHKQKSNRAISPIEIGTGNTTRWCVSSLDSTVTFAFIFDTASLEGESKNKKRFIQFVTRFRTLNGESRVRVTSISQPIAPTNPREGAQFFVQYQTFDQTCAATIIARMVVSILEKHQKKWDDARRWLDTLLVRFTQRYAVYTLSDLNSMKLDPSLSLFPSFIFYLRRSEYFMVINISPDETTFKRHWLMRDQVENCVLMIQPVLYSFDTENVAGMPVLLDSSNLRKDNTVLMDAFFNVHIMWGPTVFSWIQQGYHEDPQYPTLAEMLNNAESEAQLILDSRYPYPRFSRTDANGSEARHVKTRVNPSATHNTLGMASKQNPEQAELIYTDDSSIQTFMNSLKQAVIFPEKSIDGAKK